MIQKSFYFSLLAAGIFLEWNHLKRKEDIIGEEESKDYGRERQYKKVGNNGYKSID